MIKKTVSLICSVFMLLGYCTVEINAVSESNTFIFGTDVTTQGAWIGKYGKSGYVFFKGTATEETGRNNPPTAQDISMLPQYSAVNSISRYNYNVVGNPSTDARAPYMPDGSFRKAVAPYASGAWEMEVIINDGQYHFISFYIPTYGSGDSIRNFTLYSENGAVIQTLQVDANQAPYVTIYSNSTFRIKLSDELYGMNASITAVLFDEPEETQFDNFIAEYSGERKINLSWNGQQDGVLLRKEEDKLVEFVSNIENGRNEFVDTNLKTGVNYTYYLFARSDNGTFSKPLIAGAETEIYTASSITILSDNQKDVKLGETINVKISAKRGENAANGERISVLLKGDYADKYMEPFVGEFVTDSTGVGNFSYTPECFGEYRLEFYLDYNDEKKFDKAMCAYEFVLSAPNYIGPPYLSDISKEIAPGDIFNIYGNGLCGNIEIWAKPANAAAEAMVPADAIPIEIVGKDDSENGYFVSGIFPQYEPAGTYDLWVVNEHGSSNPIRLNAAEGLFLTENEISCENTVTLVGRNFDETKYMGNVPCEIRLKSQKGEYYSANITDKTRVSLQFTIDSDVPKGLYDIEVGSGDNWTELKSGQKLKVCAKPKQDPFKLKVAWADEFEYGIYQASSYGVTPNSGADETIRLQNAINAVEALGGGVLKLSEGTYIISEIELGHKVILSGEGKGKTFIKINNNITRKTAVFSLGSNAANEGHIGLSGFSMLPPDGDVLPRYWVNISGSGSECSKVFVSDLEIKYPFDYHKDNSSPIYIDIGGEKIIIQDCELRGYHGIAYVNKTKYCIVRNNVFEYVYGTPLFMALYADIYNNSVIGRRNEYLELRKQGIDVQNHGIKTFSKAFCHENTVTGMGAPENNEYATNDGEVILIEPPSGFFGTGSIIRADSNSVDIDINTNALKDESGNILLPNPKYGYISIAIVGGHGAGQIRDISSVQGKNTVNISEQWAVIPDESSIYSIISVIEDLTVYNNIGVDCKSSICFYGNCVNVMCAENELVSTAGIQASGFYAPQSNRATPVYNVLIKDNSLTDSGIFAYSSKYFSALNILGAEIRDNILKATASGKDAIRLYCVSGGLSDYKSFITGTIVEGNVAEGFSKGLAAESGVSGTVIGSNEFSGCDASYDILLSSNASEVIDNISETLTPIYSVDTENLPSELKVPFVCEDDIFDVVAFNSENTNFVASDVFQSEPKHYTLEFWAYIEPSQTTGYNKNLIEIRNGSYSGKLDDSTITALRHFYNDTSKNELRLHKNGKETNQDNLIRYRKQDALFGKWSHFAVSVIYRNGVYYYNTYADGKRLEATSGNAEVGADKKSVFGANIYVGNENIKISSLDVYAAALSENKINEIFSTEKQRYVDGNFEYKIAKTKIDTLGDIVNFSGEILNNSGKKTFLDLFFSIYEGQKLVCVVGQKNIEINDASKYAFDIDSTNLPKGKYDVKLFLWEGESTLHPITLPQTTQIEIVE